MSQSAEGLNLRLPSPLVKCRKCSGTGKATVYSFAEGFPYIAWIDCPACNKKGWVSK